MVRDLKDKPYVNSEPTTKISTIEAMKSYCHTNHDYGMGDIGEQIVGAPCRIIPAWGSPVAVLICHGTTHSRFLTKIRVWKAVGEIERRPLVFNRRRRPLRQMATMTTTTPATGVAD